MGYRAPNRNKIKQRRMKGGKNNGMSTINNIGQIGYGLFNRNKKKSPWVTDGIFSDVRQQYGFGKRRKKRRQKRRSQKSVSQQIGSLAINQAIKKVAPVAAPRSKVRPIAAPRSKVRPVPAPRRRRQGRISKLRDSRWRRRYN